jgi:ABC-2 type transport system permease protein
VCGCQSGASRSLHQAWASALSFATVIVAPGSRPSAYAPVSSMPGWLQAFAKHQPLTYMVDAVRSLTLGPDAEALLGHPAGYYVARALTWALAILAVSLPLAVAKYRRG